MNNKQLHPNLVRVYFNLTSKVYSVQKYITGKGWRLSYHCKEINLVDVKFICSHKTRVRVIQEGKKYVHAYFEGIDSNDEIKEGKNWGTPYWGHKVTYNPFKFPTTKGTYEYCNSFPTYNNPDSWQGGECDRSIYIIDSFWDLTYEIPRKYCEILSMKIIDKKPVMIAGIRR